MRAYETQKLRALACKIRAKIAGSDCRIKTHHGIGWSLEEVNG